MSPPRERPTDAQLEILNVLWRLGPATVRAVHDALERGSSRSYTTTLKTLQVMAERGFVQRDDSQRSHIYRAALDQDVVQELLLQDLQRKAFGGSAGSLAMKALSDQVASAAEIAAIRELLDRMERENS